MVVAGVAIGAVTLLPTLMGAFAQAAAAQASRSGSRPSPAPGRWDERITRRPWVAVIAGLAVLLALAAPFTDLRLGQPDDGNAREDSQLRVAYDKLADGFGPGFNGTLLLAALAAIRRRLGARRSSASRRAVERTEGVAAVSAAGAEPAGRRRHDHGHSDDRAAGRAHLQARRDGSATT